MFSRYKYMYLSVNLVLYPPLFMEWEFLSDCAISELLLASVTRQNKETFNPKNDFKDLANPAKNNKKNQT